MHRFKTYNDFNGWVNRERDINAYNYISFPYYLCQLVQYLRDKVEGVEIELLDARIEFYDKKETMDRIRQYRPDILAVVIGCYTVDIDQAYLNMNFTTVGFFSPSSTPAIEAVTNYNLKGNYIIQGDPEPVLEKIITAELNNHIGRFKTQYTIGNVQIVSSNEEINYSSLPLAIYHEILDIERYLNLSINSDYSYKRKWFSQNDKYVYLWHQQGCPFKCTFCQYSLLPFSRKTPEQIFQEIFYFYDRHNVMNFDFLGAEFTVDPNSAKRLCRLIIESGMKISWSSGDRVDYLDEELICLMKASGCCFLTFGVEVVSRKLRIEYNRNQNFEQFENAISLTRKHGIKTRVNMIAGLPDEGPLELKKKLNFIKKINPDAVAVNPFILGPASRLYNSLSEASGIKHKIWHRYHFMHYPKEKYPCKSRYWKSNLEIIKMADWLERRSLLHLKIRKIFKGEELLDSFKIIFKLFIPKRLVRLIKNIKNRTD